MKCISSSYLICTISDNLQKTRIINNLILSLLKSTHAKRLNFSHNVIDNYLIIYASQMILFFITFLFRKDEDVLESNL